MTEPFDMSALDLARRCLPDEDITDAYIDDDNVLRVRIGIEPEHVWMTFHAK